MVIIGLVSFIASFIALKIKIKKTLPAAAVAE
jgi:hypothetical protein